MSQLRIFFGDLNASAGHSSSGGAAVSKPGWGREATGLPRLRTLMLSFCFDTIGTMGFSISFHCYHEQATLIIDSQVPILMTETVMCPF